MKAKRIPVDLGSSGYDIVIASGLRHHLGRVLLEIAAPQSSAPPRSRGVRMTQTTQGAQVAIVTHAKVDRLYGHDVRAGLVAAGIRPLTIRLPDGERHKTLDTVGRIYDALIRHRFERGATLIALGGGVIGDLAGFAAATFLRGIACVQVPTTVVAQVDASIGGKTGVDHPLGKNLIGAFHQPRQVCVDPEVLTTLSRREYVAGLAEVVKYGVISDAGFFGDLELRAAALRARDAAVVAHCIARSAEIKAAVVASDAREMGLRKILNYGHTFGHALETLTGYEMYRHGEAVAIGMMFAARLSAYLGVMPHAAVERQACLLRTLGLPTQVLGIDPEAVLRVMARDKKVVAGAIHFVLPEKIGATRIEKVDRADLKEVLKKF